MPDHSQSRHSLKHTLFWAFTMTWGVQGMGNIVSLVLAILLGPKEFGTVSIAFVFLAFLTVLLSQGMEDTLVQRYELEEAHLNSAFWYLLCSGTVLMAACMVASGWWAGLNHQKEVGDVLRVLSVKIIIFSLIIVQRAVLVRQLGFKALALQWNVAEFVAGVIGISMALGGAGLWALVGQQLSRDVIALAFLWKTSTWRPKLHFSWAHIKALLPFSAPTFATELGSYARGQVDTMLIGLFFGPVAVGLYRLADRIRDAVLILVTRTLQWVSLPNLAKLQSDPVRLKNTYLKLLKISVTATLPLMVCLAASSDLLVRTLGAKWLAASTAISILCLMGSFEGFTVLTTPLLQARSRPFALAALVWCFGLVNGSLTTVCGFFLREASVSWQVNGTALCKLAAFVLAFLPVNIAMAKHVAGATARELFRAVSGGIAAAAVSLLAIWIVKTWLVPHHLPPALALGLALAFAMSAAGATILWLERGWRFQLVEMLKTRLTRRTSGVGPSATYQNNDLSLVATQSVLQTTKLFSKEALSQPISASSTLCNNGHVVREVASFIDFLGDQIYCVRHLAPNPRAVVVLAGPFASERPFAYIPWVRWARFLARHGYSVIRFDYRGVGESTGAFEKMGLRAWTDDVREAASQFHAEHPDALLFLHGLGLGGLLAAGLFESGLGDALLLWSAPGSGTDVLREGLMRRISINYVLQPQGARKSFDDYVQDIKSGQPLYVEGYPWSRQLWEDASHLNLPVAFTAGTENQTSDGRLWRHFKLDQSHAPLVAGLGQWQAINPRAQVQQAPLSPALDGFFKSNLVWLDQVVPAPHSELV